MLFLVLLIALSLVLQLYSSRLFRARIIRLEGNFNQLQRKQYSALKKNVKLKTENLALGKSVEEISQLYEVTKDICRSLEEEEVFKNFRDDINRFIKPKDLKFLKPDEDISSYEERNILPIKIDESLIGNLVAVDLPVSEREKFYILGGQFKLGIERSALYSKVQELAITDGLTQLLTRRYFLEKLSEEINRCQKFGLSFAFLMIDLDNFKSFNDRYGHLVGDALLRQTAITVKENIRQIDFICRYGGEEFALVLAETNQEQASIAAERIRHAVESKIINVYDESLQITVSVGMSIFSDGKSDTKSLIDKADKALYKAKQSGRNRVCI